MSSVHAIVYVSTKNQNQRGSLINAGVTGIAGLVDDFGTPSQKLMCRTFLLPSTAKEEILYKSTISFDITSNEVDADAPIEQKSETKVMNIVVIHDNNRIADIPFFSVEALDQARSENTCCKKGSPVVSEDGSTRFALNDNEMSTCAGLINSAYNFEDSFESRKDYKTMLEGIERGYGK